MDKFRYNDATERCKRANRVFVLAVCILFSVLIIYQTMLVKEGLFSQQLATASLTMLILSFLADVMIYFKDKPNKYLKYIITAEVGIAFLFYMFTTSASFLGMALIGVLGVSILYYDSKAYAFTWLAYLVLYIGGQIARVSFKVVTGDTNGVCQVIMTLAIFVMLLVIGRLSKMFSDHALGAVEEQSALQAKIMEVVKKESNISTEMVGNLFESSQTIAESMQDISYSTERFVHNITEQTSMTQDIQDAIVTAQACSSQMVSIATNSNEEIQTNQMMMEKLKEQSEQISQINTQVTKAMEGLQQKTMDVANIITMILKISKQTTILSLNASVESGRAGDAGKGFAVVAEEIRLLAEETQRATENITEMIDELSANAKEVVDAIQVSVNAAESQNEMIGATAEAFEGLRKSMNLLIDNTEEIDTRIDNLSRANNQIIENITQLSALSEEVSASAEQTNELTGCNLEYAEQTRKSIQLIQESTVGLEKK